jgi:hypothetical protein
MQKYPKYNHPVGVDFRTLDILKQIKDDLNSRSLSEVVRILVTQHLQQQREQRAA